MKANVGDWLVIKGDNSRAARSTRDDHRGALPRRLATLRRAMGKRPRHDGVSGPDAIVATSAGTGGGRRAGKGPVGANIAWRAIRGSFPTDVHTEACSASLSTQESSGASTLSEFIVNSWLAPTLL